MIIKYQYEQFEIKIRELQIEYFKSLQNYMEELLMQRLYDKYIIEAKIRIIAFQFQKELRIKYEKVCRLLIEKILKEAKGSSNITMLFTDQTILYYNGVKIKWASIHYPKIFFPNFKVITNKFGKLIIFIIDGGQVGRLFNKENESYQKEIPGPEIETDPEIDPNPEFEPGPEPELIPIDENTLKLIYQFILELIKSYINRLKLYFEELKSKGFTAQQISILMEKKILELQMEMKNEMKQILNDKFHITLIKWIEKLLLSVKFPESIYIWIKQIPTIENPKFPEIPVIPVPRPETRPETESESIDKEFNLHVIIHQVFVSIKIEIMKQFHNQQDKDRYEQQLKELEEKVEHQSIIFESTKTKLVKYCKKYLNICVKKWVNQGNVDQVYIQKELIVIKHKIVYEMRLKLEQIIKTEVYKIIQKYTKVVTTSNGTEITIIVVPKDKIEFPEIPEFPEIKFPQPGYPEPNFPGTPGFETPKPETRPGTSPQIEIESIDQEFNLHVIIHQVFVSITIEITKQFHNQQDKDRYEQQLKELEEKVEHQSVIFESIKTELVKYCKEYLKNYVEKWTSQGYDQQYIQKELTVTKHKLVHEMKLKLEEIIKTEVYQIIQKYTKVVTTSNGSEVTVINVPKTEIEMPRIEISKISTVEYPEIQVTKETTVTKLPGTWTYRVNPSPKTNELRRHLPQQVARPETEIEDVQLDNYRKMSDEQSRHDFYVADLIKTIEADIDEQKSQITHSAMASDAKEKYLNYLIDIKHILIHKIPDIAKSHEKVWAEHVERIRSEVDDPAKQSKLIEQYEKRQKRRLKQQIKSFIESELEKTMDKASVSKHWYKESIEQFKRMISFKFGA
ncbi:uncharacterized protein [Chironomus tepperi]|uniref:uncharacterized protein n=1 Tax=Chironomus tepperi TaxID=113505 RepID=UPI00391F0D8C